jgi:hypothetical protein
MVVTADIVVEAMLACYELPWEYMSAHTFTSLVPAFYIEGVIAAFVKKEAVLR